MVSISLLLKSSISIFYTYLEHCIILLLLQIGRTIALKCHVCRRGKNQTCNGVLNDDAFASDCPAYSTHCAMISVDNIVEIRGCMSTFKCRSYNDVICCLCEEDLCNRQRRCTNHNKSASITRFSLSQSLFAVTLFIVFNNTHHILL